MGVNQETIQNLKNDRLGQIRVNHVGDIGKVVGFNNNSCHYVLVQINNNEIRTVKWNYFNEGVFYGKYKYNRIGEKKYNNQGSLMEIIDYRSTNDIDIKFQTGYITYHRAYSEFKEGEVKDYYYPYASGVGFTGVGEYNTKSNIYGKNIKSVWEGMLSRCYAPPTLKTQKSYEGCSVDKIWFNFQEFAKWFEQNYYIIQDTKMHLDKDLLIKNNKIYGPEYCCIIPQEINNLILKRNKRNSIYPPGVSKDCSKYIASVSRHRLGTIRGRFLTPEEAFAFYKEKKEEYIKYVADIYKDQIPQKVYDALYAYEVEITD